MFGPFRRLLERRRHSGDGSAHAHEYPEHPLTGKLQDDMESIRAVLEDSADLSMRTFFTGAHSKRAAVIYLEGMVDTSTLQSHVLAPIIQFTSLADGLGSWDADMGKLAEHLMGTAISAAKVGESHHIDELVNLILTGHVVILIDGQKAALAVNCPGVAERAVGETLTERTVRGPKEAFNENIQTNIALVRRRARSTGLKVEILTVGRRSRTRVAMLYYVDIVQEELVNEVRRRLRTISTDVIDSTGQIEQFIEDNTWSTFPQLLNTERPDKVLAAVAAGRVAILVDGAPFALVAPSVFADFFVSPDDYYERWIVGSVIRITRFTNAILTSLLPAAYIAIVAYNPGLLPTQLALTITGARVEAPFPAFFEALLMEIVLEVLQEAGVRLPQAVGQTVTFIGGLVIGQAAIQAGLVSPIMVIVVSLTAVTSFTIPIYSMNLALRLLRVPLMIAANFLGLYGLAIAILFLLIHLCSLKSFGKAYLAPLTPYNPRDWKDALIRLPTEMMSTRPEFLKPKDQDRSESATQSSGRGARKGDRKGG